MGSFPSLVQNFWGHDPLFQYVPPPMNNYQKRNFIDKCNLSFQNAIKDLKKEFKISGAFLAVFGHFR